MMDRSPQGYIPSDMEIRPPVPDKIFESFFSIYGRGGHLGHVTWTIFFFFDDIKLSYLYYKIHHQYI